MIDFFCRVMCHWFLNAFSIYQQVLSLNIWRSNVLKKKPTRLNDWMLFISSCLCLDIQTKIANPTLYVTSPLLPCLYILRHFTNHRRHCKDLFLAIKMIKSPININMWNWLMHIDEEITCCLYDFRFGNDDCRAELLPLRWRQFSMYTIFNRQNMQWGH